VASVLIFTLLGWYIDSSRGTKPIGILVGLCIGLISGFYHLAKTIWTRKR
jgi:F0F1-type ATP synthase assembly protein I